MIADDVKLVREVLAAGVDAGPYPEALWCKQEAYAAINRILALYQRNLAAIARLTDLANNMAKIEDDSTDLKYASSWAFDIRQALGDAYLGGPLL